MSAKRITNLLLRAAKFVEEAPKLAKGVEVIGADMLDDHGYQTYDGPGRGKNCYCAFGAILAAESSKPYSEETRKAAQRMLAHTILGEVFDEGSAYRAYEAITIWNDEPARTQAEVVVMLRRAAGKADNGL